MSFDILAPHYRWMESVLAGEKLQRCRTQFLPEISEAKNILLLGEGHGRSLIEYRRRFPQAQITCLDASAVMLNQARCQLGRFNLEANEIKFIHANVLDWAPEDGQYDVIATNFFLDCFRPDQLEQIVQKISLATTPSANWLIADFQTAPTGLQRLRSRLILWSMYVFFRVVTRLPAKRLTSPDSYLEHSGFTLRRRVQSEWGLLHSDWWQRGNDGLSQSKH